MKNLDITDIKVYFSLRAKLPKTKGKDYKMIRVDVENLRAKIISYFGFDLDKK